MKILYQESQVIETTKPSEDKEYPTSLIFMVSVFQVYFMYLLTTHSPLGLLLLKGERGEIKCMCYSPQWTRHTQGKAASPTRKQRSHHTLLSAAEEGTPRMHGGDKGSRVWRSSSSTVCLLSPWGCNAWWEQMRVVLTSCGLEPWESSSTDPYPLMPGCCPKICQNRCHLKRVLTWKSRLNWSIWKDCPERDNGPLMSICDKQVRGSGNSVPASPRACCKEGERKQPTQEPASISQLGSQIKCLPWDCLLTQPKFGRICLAILHHSDRFVLFCSDQFSLMMLLPETNEQNVTVLEICQLLPCLCPIQK